MSTSSKVKFIVVLLAGITVPGLLVYWLSSIGASQLGEVVWALGYGTTILVIWYGWIRPIDFGLTGPDVDSENVWEANRKQVEIENHRFAERTSSRNSEHNGGK